MKKLSGLWIRLMFFLVVGGVTIFKEYMVQHPYYLTMLGLSNESDGAGSNRLLMLWGIISAMIPVGYSMMSDRPTARGMGYTILSSIIVFAYSFIAVRDEFVGSGVVMLLLNMVIVVSLIGLSLGMMGSLGSVAFSLIYKKEVQGFDDIIQSFIIGFVGLLLGSWVLVVSTLLYQVVVAAVVVAGGWLIYKERSFWSKVAVVIEEFIQQHIGYNSIANTITTTLFIMTVMYFVYGLMLAYIPYPTAWDANHAYMYIPKVWAEHHGYLWNSISAQFSPSPWLTYVSVWFQFGYLFKSIGGWIWPDTIAVIMNYAVVIPVMIFVLGLVKRIISYAKLQHSTGLYHIAWIILLSWMTSGMGAFLVFVDNKSDFGILAITLASLVMIFEWMPSFVKHDDSMQYKNTTIINVVMSGLIAGVAVFSKPTSLFDFASIAILFIGALWGLWSVLGMGMIVMGLMAMMKITTVPLYLSTTAGLWFVIGGIVLILLGGYRHRFAGIKLTRLFVYWGCCMIGYLAIMKTPFLINRVVVSGSTIDGVKGYIQSVLMGYHQTSKPVLFAQATNTVPTPRSCSLESEGLTKETLYDGLLTSTTEGAGEDLGRYIGYGSKIFSHKRWTSLIPQNVCITFDHDARIICENRQSVEQGNVGELESKVQGGAKKLFDAALQDKKSGVSESYIAQNLTRQLRLYWQDKALVRDNTGLSVPYRWIVPLNITYNWSLQNLSSYYTDIGIVWLILLVIVLSSFIALLCYDRRKALIPGVTLMSWVIRWISGSAILWYGIGLIIWLLLSSLIIYDDRSHRTSTSKERNLLQSVLWGVVVIITIQFILNFIRIGSQGGSGIFVQYKTSNGLTQWFSDDLTPSAKVDYKVSGQDIFNLQFPHYTKTIEAIDSEKGSKNAVLIAGTYMPYFLYNQYNIISDGFLTELWRWFSDQNTCRGYLRLQDKKLTYLVIDPNIASVVMGEGNSTLRDRMFAQIDPITKKITRDGAISSLAHMVSAGYIELFDTNNIAAKYAFQFSDDQIMSIFGSTKEDIALTRTKIATARFWGAEGEPLLQKVLQLFSQRMSTPAGIEDLADIFGKKIDTQKLVSIAQTVGNKTVVESIKGLTQDERFVLANYLTLMSSVKSQPTQYQNQLIGLLQQSIGGGSQLIVFKVR